MVTLENLQLLHDRGIRFLSRLPNTFTKSDLLREKAFKDDRWAEQGVLAHSPLKGVAEWDDLV